MRGRLGIALVLGAGQALGRGMLALYTILMVRELTKAGYGDFAYALAVVGIGTQIGDAGLSRLTSAMRRGRTGGRRWPGS